METHWQAPGCSDTTGLVVLELHDRRIRTHNLVLGGPGVRDGAQGQAPPCEFGREEDAIPVTITGFERPWAYNKPADWARGPENDARAPRATHEVEFENLRFAANRPGHE
jgi:hypothetical protein